MKISYDKFVETKLPYGLLLSVIIKDLKQSINPEKTIFYDIVSIAKSSVEKISKKIYRDQNIDYAQDLPISFDVKIACDNLDLLLDDLR